MRFQSVAAVVAMAGVLLPGAWNREQPGLRTDGSVLLRTGWKIHPAGEQVPTGVFPMSMAVSRDGRSLVVLNRGGQASVSVLDIASQSVQSSAPVPGGWLGLCLAPRGGNVYVGGGAEATIFEFRLDAGRLTPSRAFPIVPRARRSRQDFIGDVQLSPDGRMLYAASLYRNEVVVVNPQSGMVVERFKTGRRPYRILFAPDGKSFFVSSWADGTVYQHSADTGSKLAAIHAGLHPTDMILSNRVAVAGGEEKPWWAARLFVAASNTNSVYVYGVSEAGTEVRRLETINVALAPMQPAGSTPSALALSADQKTLYVACSDGNSVAVVDISGERSEVSGFVPAGRYPTAVRSLEDGRLVVLNGLGSGSPAHSGTASFIAPFDADQLDQYTATVRRNSPYRDAGAGVPVAGVPAAIRHVVYIISQGCTYDQAFGGGGAAPNHHRLAREFVLFDNFYASGDTAAGGLNWATAAIAGDYVRKMPAADYNESDPAALPPAGYLWTNAAAAGKTMRSYGFLVENTPQAQPTGEIQINRVRDSALNAVTNRKYRGFDPAYPDTDRARIFLEDLAEFEKSGQMPALTLVRLDGARAAGTAAFAGYDYALGQIIEGVSKSSFWPTTAIFVLANGAGGGPGNVDSHRSPVFVVSPYTRRGVVDSTMYATASMLRTIEAALGLRPMTVFDAGAPVMAPAFQAAADPRPYQCEKPAK